jgi:hypothetical protein
MLEREFLAALDSVSLPEDSDARAPRMSASLLRSWKHSGIPDWIFRAVTSAYHSHRFDPILHGPFRHVNFARWFAQPQNFRKVRRLACMHLRTIRREELRARVNTLTAELRETRAALAEIGG